MSDQPPLSVRGLSKSFGALRAVDDVSFDVEPGEIVGFCGPNGAGKTTLFDLICGLTVADRGEITAGGTAMPLSRPDIRVKHGLARSFQLNAAFESLSVADNLLLSARFGRAPAIATPERIADVAAEFDLTEVMDTPAGALSVLQSKILMLACACCADPEVILLDEPVGGLSPAEIDAYREIVLRLNREEGITFLVIEHVMPFLMSISNRVIFLHEGKVAFDGAPADLARDRRIVSLYLGETVASLLTEKA